MNCRQGRDQAVWRIDTKRIPEGFWSSVHVSHSLQAPSGVDDRHNSGSGFITGCFYPSNCLILPCRQFMDLRIEDSSSAGFLSFPPYRGSRRWMRKLMMAACDTANDTPMTRDDPLVILLLLPPLLPSAADTFAVHWRCKNTLQLRITHSIGYPELLA